VFIQFADVWLAHTKLGSHLRLLTSLTLIATPQVTAALQPLVSCVIFHCATAPQTLSHYLSHFQ
jgi:hypothetical protein